MGRKRQKIALDQFVAVANVIDQLPDRIADDVPLREVLPGTWPTVGDLRKLRDDLTPQKRKAA